MCGCASSVKEIKVTMQHACNPVAGGSLCVQGQCEYCIVFTLHCEDLAQKANQAASYTVICSFLCIMLDILKEKIFKNSVQKLILKCLRETTNQEKYFVKKK